MKKAPKYDPATIEKKWQKKWASQKTYTTPEPADPTGSDKAKKYYVLDMFPYPSGEGLHVGHPKGYIATDIVSRMKRMQGYSVLHPMGFDAFGLPAENYALKTKTNPADSVKENVARYKKQLEILGFDYDWSREVNTTDPAYYTWTQWIFLQLFKKGLAYESFEPINWCPSCKTGLANEDVENGRCERCGTPVEKKPLRQWVLKITDYADRLLKDLDATGGIPLVTQTTGEDGVREGLPFVERSPAVCIIKHWAEDTYLCIKWKASGWQGFVIGGPENDESLAEAAIREIREETGYTGAKFVSEIGKVDAKFYQMVKKVNRLAHFTGLYLELTNGERLPVSEEEKNLQEVVWLSKDQVREFITHEDMLYLWDIFVGTRKQEIRPLLDWPNSIKEAQRNWIGRSEGAEIDFLLDFKKNPKDNERRGPDGERAKIKVFTTRPDTIFGVTYIVLSPEHLWVRLATDDDHDVLLNKAEVKAYIESVAAKPEIERTANDKEKTGIELKGVKAINPANGEEIPIFVADYVLAHYGTGAVMAVPAHDERDQEFAQKFGLPTKQVEEDGKLIHSGTFDGRDSESVKKDITTSVGGKWVTRYKLRDWVFSRQRYWGEPIPVVHCPVHGAVAVPEKDLPVRLPKVKSYEPTGTGESPLAAIEKWVNTKCPQCVAEKKKPKYFIFDFDGVLGDTKDAAIQARMGLEDIQTREEAERYFTDYFNKKPHHTRDAGQSPEQKKDDLDFTRRLGTIITSHNPPLFKDFIAEVKKYKNAQCAVVSSGSELYVKTSLAKAGIRFSHVLSFEDHHSKEEKVERICKDWDVDVKDIYFFTDSKADVYEMENILDRAKIIGCSWGYLGFDALAEVLPERQILKTFKDVHDFFNVDCKAKRETNTMPQWAGSSWYYLRYEDPKNKKVLVDPVKEKYWSPVDLYVGGAEHATRHLIYARFWHKFLYDIGVVSDIEPFTKLQNVGLIMGEDGRKMSKRFGNVINPDDIVATFGADTLRLYEMFMGPFDQQIAWNTDSMVGSRRFIERVWKLAEQVITNRFSVGAQDNPKNSTAMSIINKTIKKVTDDITNLRFNTAISSLMIALNELETTHKSIPITREDFETFLKLLAPFAPHVTEELWSLLGHASGAKNSIHHAPWPTYDPALVTDSEVTIVVQINGKVRASFMAEKGTAKTVLEEKARALPAVQKWLNGGEVKTVIVIPDRLVNLVLT